MEINQYYTNIFKYQLSALVQLLPGKHRNMNDISRFVQLNRFVKKKSKIIHYQAVGESYVNESFRYHFAGIPRRRMR